MSLAINSISLQHSKTQSKLTGMHYWFYSRHTPIAKKNDVTIHKLHQIAIFFKYYYLVFVPQDPACHPWDYYGSKKNLVKGKRTITIINGKHHYVFIVS